MSSKNWFKIMYLTFFPLKHVGNDYSDMYIEVADILK